MTVGGSHASDTWQESLWEHKLRQADRIVHAAVQLVFEQGVSALSMSAIARAAGVSRQTLYKYFPDVESVLGAAVQSTSLHDTTSIEAEEAPADQLAAFVQYVLSAVAAGHPSPAALEPVLGPEARVEIQKHASRIRDLVALILRRGVDDGEFASDLDPDLDGEIVYRTVMAIADLAAQAGDMEQVRERTERAVLRMVGYDN